MDVSTSTKLLNKKFNNIVLLYFNEIFYSAMVLRIENDKNSMVARAFKNNELKKGYLINYEEATVPMHLYTHTDLRMHIVSGLDCHQSPKLSTVGPLYKCITAYVPVNHDHRVS